MVDSVQCLAGKLARWRWPRMEGSALGWVRLPPPGEWPNATVQGVKCVGHARIRAEQLMLPATLGSSPQARRCERLPIVGRGILFRRSVVGQLGRQRSSACPVRCGSPSRCGPPSEEAGPPPSAACDRTAQSNQRKRGCSKGSSRLGL